MVPVIDNELVFGRDQVVTSSQVEKDFGVVRRKAQAKPLFVSDGEGGIDTVIVGFDEFEAMALELERFRRADARVADAPRASAVSPDVLPDAQTDAPDVAPAASDAEAVASRGEVLASDAEVVAPAAEAVSPDFATAELEEDVSRPRVPLPDAKVGDAVEFGSYRQGAAEFGGAEPIEWLVLDKRDDKVLLVSRRALDCKTYNDEREGVTWETCSLRAWLNEEFFEEAFSEAEQALIARTKVPNPGNERYETEGGRDTVDAVFLLSTAEVGRYFPSVGDRVCRPTDYAISRGPRANGVTVACCWWLRSPGDGPRNAAGVDSDGSVDLIGWLGDYVVNAVRPALWVNLRSEASCAAEAPCEEGAEPRGADVSQTDAAAPEGNVSHPKVPLLDAKVGYAVEFGSYRQGAESDIAESIEWLVVDKRDDKVLLVSRRALDCKQYNDNNELVTWETCSLRSWLNGEFYETAFSDAERALVGRTRIPNPSNTTFGTNGGRDTVDAVFLLGADEVRRYLPSAGDRACHPTDYAVSRGAEEHDESGACYWWLRSPGRGSRRAAYVFSVGSVSSGGCRVFDDGLAVRPALWVNLRNEASRAATISTEVTAEPRVVAGSRIDASAPAPDAVLEGRAPRPRVSLLDANVGDTVRFGFFRQGAAEYSDIEPIEWLVLDRRVDGALLVSKRALDCRFYNDTNGPIDWETCSLRAWLNGEFYANAFSGAQRALIARVKLRNPDNKPNNKRSGANSGRDTVDSVFLLSATEVIRYLPSTAKRVCLPTDYAVSRGAWKNCTGACLWWLRSPGDAPGSAAYVYSDGSTRSDGRRVDRGACAVRPALWVNL